MSNYSNNPESVRVDFFRPSGKWCDTEAVIFVGPWAATTDNLIHDAFRRSLQAHFKDNPTRMQGMIAVCLEPYHEHSHPIMLKEW